MHSFLAVARTALIGSVVLIGLSGCGGDDAESYSADEQRSIDKLMSNDPSLRTSGEAVAFAEEFCAEATEARTLAEMDFLMRNDRYLDLGGIAAKLRCPEVSSRLETYVLSSEGQKRSEELIAKYEKLGRAY